MAEESTCQYCYESPAPPEQFYETKLFRVLVARKAFGEGHIVIIPKRHDPHFYGFSLDELEEFGYLVKKASFWAMRLTRAPGFSLVMNDGTPEVQDNDHLEIHVLPRPIGSQPVAGTDATDELADEDIQRIVGELQNLMQLPQEQQTQQQ